ncbi:class I SAM-dependent methyltransferase [Halarchaeum sp. CBA1220]|uniref:class I SAM-dependent methyltransferase n=1 Tax=Halarchaeum sp. CBA1220 TaxID=1853682 RepID=UPI000F3A99B4|nr:class I SAM-dependent methyltransferase [Halarchaeum sp. CBA1220]QLC34307.1 class I SAM-dependent methyltransferase [Halarchaeum sp. CBA1220]
MADVARFDRLAAVYDWFAGAIPRPDVASGFAYAERDVERVLDLAGGTGRTAAALPDYDVTVLDAAAGMLREARAKGLPVVRGDATRLPVATGSVDAVVVTDALHHLDAPAAIGEAARVLRPGGVLVACDYDPRGPLGRALVAAEHAAGFDSTFYARGELAAVLAGAGLDVHALEAGFAYALVGVTPAERAERDSREGRERGEPVRG